MLLSIILPIVLQEVKIEDRFWLRLFHDVCIYWQSEKMLVDMQCVYLREGKMNMCPVS